MSFPGSRPSLCQAAVLEVIFPIGSFSFVTKRQLPRFPLVGFFFVLCFFFFSGGEDPTMFLGNGPSLPPRRPVFLPRKKGRVFFFSFHRVFGPLFRGNFFLRGAHRFNRPIALLFFDFSLVTSSFSFFQSSCFHMQGQLDNFFLRFFFPRMPFFWDVTTFVWQITTLAIEGRPLFARLASLQGTALPPPSRTPFFFLQESVCYSQPWHNSFFFFPIFEAIHFLPPPLHAP